MVNWTQESSGVISLNSAGSWLQNIMIRSYRLLPSSSVGAVATTPVGSDRVQVDLLIQA